MEHCASAGRISCSYGFLLEQNARNWLYDPYLTCSLCAHFYEASNIVQVYIRSHFLLNALDFHPFYKFWEILKSQQAKRGWNCWRVSENLFGGRISVEANGEELAQNEVTFEGKIVILNWGVCDGGTSNGLLHTRQGQLRWWRSTLVAAEQVMVECGGVNV
ncbi:Uncharacterized protein Adt_38026 [Abeliophyllum distichum]|uniref:Uncharacterized protein n=1 Tax=Abeliophyllum distichum TaxID=126358 RepID=A0ABD1Q125_9LAMI